MEQFDISNTCTTCGSLRISVPDESTGDELLKQCLNCGQVDGIDDSYSPLLEKIEKGITEHFNQDKCPKCGNYDVNKFTYQMRNDAIVLECQCGCILDLDDNMDMVFNIEDHEMTTDCTSPDEVELPKSPDLFECECGNTDGGFVTTKNIYFDKQETKYIKCEACTRERYFSRNSMEQSQRHTSNQKKILVLQPFRQLTHQNGARNRNVFNVPRRKVEDINTLKHGDHVAWSRWGYWHHGIIEIVDSFGGLLLVIEYDGPTGTIFKGKGIVKENRLEFSIEHLYKYFYPDGMFYSPIDTIKRAKSKLGQNTYNLFTNNCEHFARWAKTGVHISFQVEEAKHIVKSEVKAFMSQVVKFGVNVFKNPREMPKLQKPTFGLTAGMVCINLAAEVTCIVDDIKGYIRDRDMAKIDDDELTNLIIQRISEGIGSAGGSTSGAMAGAVVGMWLGPFVGGITGLVGSTVGSIIGRFLGRVVGKGINTLRRKGTKTPNLYLNKHEQIKEK